MLKLGVYRLDQFYAVHRQGLAASIRFQLTRGRTSMQLLGADLPLPEKVALFERIIRGVQLSSGVWRYTSRGRFEQLDGYLNRILAKHFDSGAALDVHDWAASDCSTSAEWASALSSQFPNARLTASDLMLFVVEGTLPDGDAYIFEPSGVPLQYIHPPFVIRLSPPERPVLPVNWALCRRVRPKAQDLWRQWAIPSSWIESGSETLEQPPLMFRKISLIHPEAEALRRRSNLFTVRKHSIFDRLPDCCDVIRSMNILNRSYFSETRLLEGARAVWLSLKPEGIWIVGRTLKENPPVHAATVFTKDERGFRLIDRYDKGSEIDELVAGATFNDRAE